MNMNWILVDMRVTESEDFSCAHTVQKAFMYSPLIQLFGSRLVLLASSTAVMLSIYSQSF